MRLSDTVDRSYEQEIVEAGVTITVNRQTTGRFDPAAADFSIREFKVDPKGRYYELINSRWHRVKS